VRAIKAHSGRFHVRPGHPIDSRIFEPDIDAVREGLPNMIAHLETLAAFGVPAVVAINRFASDTDEELDAIGEAAQAAGAFDVAVSEVHTYGGAGGEALADAVIRAAETNEQADFQMLYEPDWPIDKKIETIARRVYGAEGVDYAPPARRAIESLTRLAFDKLPICLAKTQYSLSHDPTLRGRPTGFTLPVQDIRLAGGAGFLTPLVGRIQTMPAFGRHPAALQMDIDDDGTIRGLF
jgi:formyltetrahydrofolate synthetase